MIVILAFAALLQVSAAEAVDSDEERARVAGLASSDVGAAESDLSAVCRQAGEAQQRLRDIADRETAARVLVARRIELGDASPLLREAEELLADQGDLALAHMILDWSRNRACGRD